MSVQLTEHAVQDRIIGNLKEVLSFDLPAEDVKTLDTLSFQVALRAAAASASTSWAAAVASCQGSEAEF